VFPYDEEYSFRLFCDNLAEAQTKAYQRSKAGCPPVGCKDRGTRDLSLWTSGGDSVRHQILLVDEDTTGSDLQTVQEVS
jgi:hypothetical protein